MNQNKRFNLIQKKCRVQMWDMKLILSLIIVIGINNSGCKKNDSNNDEYYVKYEVSSSTIYFGGRLKVILKTENNQNKSDTIPTRAAWENTIGPVKRGFVSNLSISEIESNYGHLKLNTQISVSKNGSPFALKQSDNSDIPRTSVQINYTIDY